MRALVICQDELVIRTLQRVLMSSYQVEFLLDCRPLARRLTDAGVEVTTGDPGRVDTYLKADLSPTTPVIVVDNGRRSVKRIVAAIRDAGGTLIYLLKVGPQSENRASADARDRFPEVTELELAELVGPPLETALGRSLTLAHVRQYQRYFADADRVLILLHNDPDPDALASGLALRSLLRRTTPLSAEMLTSAGRPSSPRCTATSWPLRSILLSTFE